MSGYKKYLKRRGQKSADKKEQRGGGNGDVGPGRGMFSRKELGKTEK
jgi:hypothetical protein